MIGNRRKFIKSALLAAAALPAASRILSGSDETAAEIYTVKKGDTLSGISARFKVPIDQLRSLNNLRGDRIDAGQKLIIRSSLPTHQIYIVKTGDTLGQIALDHKTTVDAIQTANRLTGDRIYPGQELIVSGNPPSRGTRYTSEVIRLTRSLSIPLRRWEYIVIHHSAINNGNAKSYDRFHRREMKMTNGLAYHFVIGNGIDSGNGEIEIGNRWLKQLQGGHVRNHRVNEVGIGICLVGNFEARYPTPQQLAALNELISFLKYDLLDGRPKLTVHREVDGNRTLCPGRNFPTAQIRQLFP